MKRVAKIQFVVEFTEAIANLEASVNGKQILVELQPVESTGGSGIYKITWQCQVLLHSYDTLSLEFKSTSDEIANRRKKKPALHVRILSQLGGKAFSVKRKLPDSSSLTTLKLSKFNLISGEFLTKLFWYPPLLPVDLSCLNQDESVLFFQTPTKSLSK